MRILSLTLFVVISCGCSHTLYQSEFIARDDKNTERKYIFYWTHTSPLIGEDKAGPGKLMSECRSTKEFTESGEDSPIILELGRDRFQPEDSQSGNSLICGSISKLNQFRNYQSGPLLMSINCKPMTNEFDAVPESLPAIGTYKLGIEKKASVWSIIRNPNIEPVPIGMDCTEG